MDFSRIRERARASLREFRDYAYSLAVRAYKRGQPTEREEAEYWRAILKVIARLSPELKSGARSIARRAWADAKRGYSEARRNSAPLAESTQMTDEDLTTMLLIWLSSDKVFTTTETFIWKLSIHIEGEARQAYCVNQLNGGDGSEDKNPSKERVSKAEEALKREGLAPSGAQAEEARKPEPGATGTDKEDKPSTSSTGGAPAEGGEEPPATGATLSTAPTKGEGKARKGTEGAGIIDPADLRLPVFYLASQHADSAEDHVDAQGEIYLDKRWTRKIKGEALREAVRREKERRGMEYYQDIIFRPVWLVTRPNCRHYFIPLKTEDVISGTPESELLWENGADTEEGDWERQTERHSTRPSWYTKENVANIIRRYYSRLNYHKALAKADPNNRQAREQIEKDKLLIRKWRAYYRNNFGENFAG